MRFKLRTAILSLLAVLALGAPAASAAYPEFSSNQLKYPSKLLKGPGPGEASFETGIGNWRFANNTFAGEITGAKTLGNVTINFAGPGEVSCWFHKEPAFANLNGRLGYINKAKKEVGMIFEPTKESIATCSLFGIPYEYVGQFIAHITPINSLQKTFTLTFRQFRSQQEPEFLEGETESFPKRFPLKLARSWFCAPPEETFCEMKEPRKVGLAWSAQFELPVAAVLRA